MKTQTFQALAEKYMDVVYRVAYNSLKNPHDADDVTQEVFVRLLRTKADFESEEHAKRWLIRVAVNESRRLACSPWRRHTAALEDCGEIPQWDTHQESDMFRQVMALPSKYRVPLYLYYYEELSTQEIAGVLGRSPSTVRTQLSRAREQLKTLLLEEWSDA